MTRLIALALVTLQALAPGGTFVDDNESVHEGSIEAIFAAGLTKGCNPPASDRYCPEDPVTRGEMAAFLTRAFSLSATSTDHFDDDGGSIFEGDINRLATAGITKGCNPPGNTRFCPDEDMTRGEMAAMLVRAFDYTGPRTDRFIDDDGSTFEWDIDRLAAAKVTLGCNPPDNTRFCPNDTVTRAEMASFLARALGLKAIDPPADARYWAANSPLNQKIPSGPRLDTRSGAMVNHLSQDVVFDLYEYGIAIYQVSASTPKVDVYCTANWGTCPTDTLNPIPMPTNTEPPPGTDGNTVLVDWSRERAVSMHKPVKNANGTWSATWVTVADLDGSGIPPQGGNGAGFSHLAGVVELDEIERGHIDHALVFSTDDLCVESRLRYPARKSDGESTGANCIPAGARVQLDPSINLDQLNLSKGERAVARALQEYGAYAVDRGGATMALYFQVAPDAGPGNPGKVYRDAGFPIDYFGADAIPWDRLRVLAAWNGS